MRRSSFETVLPYLQQVRKLGCDAIVECTPAYFGRDPQLLRRLSEASGVRILSNTGYYGAAKDKHLPAFAFTESAEQLAARWIREAERGIDDTSIKPAFMKIGVDEAPLSDIDAKLVRAAAIAHRATGLPIASHTGTGAAAMAELDLLDAAAVPFSAFIWVHAQSERDNTFSRPSGTTWSLGGVRWHQPGKSCSTPGARSADEEPTVCSTTCWCRTTPGGITSANRAAASSGHTLHSSPTSFRG